MAPTKAGTLAAAMLSLSVAAVASAQGGTAPGIQAETSRSAGGPGQGYKRLHVGLGLLLHELGGYSHDPSGATAAGGYLLPDLGLMGRFRFGLWGVSPLMAFTPLGFSDADGGVTTRVLRLEVRGTREVAHWLDAQIGVGLFNAMSTGGGGTVSLNNGNTTTTFGIPSASSTSRLFYWQTGASFRAFREARLEASILLGAPLSSERYFSFSALLSYGVI